LRPVPEQSLLCLEIGRSRLKVPIDVVLHLWSSKLDKALSLFSPVVNFHRFFRRRKAVANLGTVLPQFGIESAGEGDNS